MVLEERHLMPDQHQHWEGHIHGAPDQALLTTERGIRAVKWSFVGLTATALIQTTIVWLSGSVALLADTIHNFGDAGTTLPLWIAFVLARRKPSKRFSYGLGRVEDLAGVAIVLTILASAALAGYESIDRIFEPRDVRHLWTVAAAALVGFVGNEAIARFRIKVGEEIGSAALIADGRHAHADGLTSLAVLGGALGIWWGYPLADPIVGLLITAAILRIVWQAGKSVFSRLLDGVDPEVIDEIRAATVGVGGVAQVTGVRARWLGHRLHAELEIAVRPGLSVEEGHEVAVEVRKKLLDRLPHLSGTTIHVDPVNASGAEYHDREEKPN